jgi:hypothetical protein
MIMGNYYQLTRIVEMNLSLTFPPSFYLRFMEEYSIFSRKAYISEGLINILVRS